MIDKAQSDEAPTLSSVVSESTPHLKRGVIKDFLDIMKNHQYYKDDRWNRTSYTYEFESGSKIEFFSADQPGKVRGPRRDRLFINEANNIPYETFDQLEVRTKDFVFLDWNPTNEFWFYTDVLNKRDDVEFITLTYKDNEALDPQIVASIESHKGNTKWWQVYGLGQLGESEERVYKDWQIIDEIPHEARLWRRGMDFGYTNDPTVLIDIYEYQGGYILDETIYQKGLLNKSIFDIVQNLPEPNILIIADSADPKSIDELKMYGLNIIGAKKGQGSVNQGIQFVQGLKISITKKSVKTIKAYRNYCYYIDKNGKITNDPDDSIHEWSNSMDAARYGFNGVITGKINQDIERTILENIKNQNNPIYVR